MILETVYKAQVICLRTGTFLEDTCEVLVPVL